MQFVTLIVGFCNCSLFCCALLCVHSSFAIISLGKTELVALLCLSSWCPVIVVWLFPTMPRVRLQFLIVVFPDHTHLLFLVLITKTIKVKLENGLKVFWFADCHDDQNCNKFVEFLLENYVTFD